GEKWSYGRFERYLTGLSERARDNARLARALLSRGRRAAAERFVIKSQAAGGGPETERGIRLLMLFQDRDADDAEVPLYAGEIAAPTPPPGSTAAEQARLRSDFEAVRVALRKRMWAHAIQALRKWPQRSIDAMGPDTRLLLGFLLYKTDL